MLIDRHQSLLLIVDIQEKLAPAIHEGAAAIANNQRLLAAADRLGVPIVVSEQYVRGLGPTVQDLQPLPPGRNASRRCISPARANPDFST